MANKTKAELAEENEALRADIAVIAERIREEALTRSWCSEYQSVMDEINAATSEPWMQPCERTVSVGRIEGTVTIRFSDLSFEDMDYRGSQPDDDDVVRAVMEWARETLVRSNYPSDGVADLDVRTWAVR